ncbi:PAS domain-containing hybrid sensor histidine kinase/response regulator [Massilia phyllosphaerae]|uniref:PAS domain-containing hybrid sensor histidine kinase/response regulator n=1 Tax=Massilia phyllosphaerae TaxID=3106034 RepID=UPI002B1CAD1C|nr:PAS domain-containing protein [Massilia sp. SGZ-792]
MTDQDRPPITTSDGIVERALRDGAGALGPMDAWPVALRYAARFLLDSASPAFLVWGPEARLLYNDACLPQLAQRHPQALGQPLAQAWPAVAAALQPVLAQVLAGVALQVEPPGLDARLALAPLRDLDGSACGVSCALLHSVAVDGQDPQFRAIADAVPQMVWSTLPDGRHDYFSQRWYDFTGVAEGESDDERWSAIVHSDDRARTWEVWRHSLETGAPYEIEYRLRHVSGDYRWTLGRALPVRDGAGRIVRWLGTCTDTHEHKANQAALHDARLREEAALVAADIGTWTYDVRADRLYADRNLATIFGATEAVAVGGPLAHYLEAIHPDDLERTRKAIDTTIATGQAFEQRYRVRAADGSWRHVLARAKLTRDEAGQAAWMPGIVLDITRQQEVEDALRASETRFRRLVDANVIGIVRYHMDGTIIDANQHFLDMLGYTRADLEAGRLSSSALTPPEWQAANARVMARLRQTGSMDHHIKEYYRKDGSRVSVQMGATMVDDGAADDNAEGIAYVVDISPIRDAQLALARSEAQFRTLADNIPQLAWMTEADGRISWHNNRWYEYTGTTPADDCGADWKKVHHPDYVDAMTAKYIDHIRRGVVWEDTFQLRGRDGSYRWFLSRAVPLRDEAGVIQRWFGTNTDITEQREAAEALREADQRKDEFLAMLAHELRNPLAPIAAAADFLTIGNPDRARLREVTAVIARQAGHMTGLIDDLLDVSRVTRGQVTLNRAPAEIGALVAEAAEQVRPLVEAKGHVLTLAPAPDTMQVQVHGDHKRLVQVFANLLGNAARYTPEGGHIAVRVDVREDEVDVEVLDDGIGMSPQLLACAFELFSQGERSADRSQGGLGIGLALARRLVELHGGRISAASDGPGQGSRFSVTLPRLRQHGAEAAPGDEAEAVPAAAGLRVLIVDDNVDAAQILAMFIEALGHRADVLHRPSEALDYVQHVRPDLCVLDIGLPEFDGYELAARLRAMPGLHKLPLVALSGYGQAQDREKALAAGFDRHVVKPIQGNDVMALLAAAELARAPQM